MTKSIASKPYALVRARHAQGYGHLDIQVINLFPNIYDAPKFVIRAQTGGGKDMSKIMYGEKFGVESNLDPMRSTHLKAALTVIRRIEGARLKRAAEGTAQPGFPGFALEILHAARVRHVHYVQRVNGSWSGCETTLPSIDCLADPQGAIIKLQEMSEALYALN